MALQKVVFASANAHKIDEVKMILSGIAEVISPAELGFTQDIPENGTTFEANALIKAHAIYKATGLACIADDSGLCVEALNDEPGVFSARYAGEPVNHANNIQKILDNLGDSANRRARFVAVLCAVGFSEQPLFARGEVHGEILLTPQGEGGFGYDPVFKADGMDKSFAQCTPEEKNAMSHRGRAWKAMLPLLSAKVPEIPVADFDYPLTDDRIAKFPVSPRDTSKLLVSSGNLISHAIFSELPEFLASNGTDESVLLVTNSTKVIPARLHGTTESGAAVEIFLLDPLSPDWQLWQTMVGGRKKFKENGSVLVSHGDCALEITWHNRDKDQVKLAVLSGDLTIMEAIDQLGRVPLPPYLNREVEPEDRERYQAIFADTPGAVAAPTASLHFTESLLERLSASGVQFTSALLHVGAGTFRPMSGNSASEHDMHAERFEISVETLKKLRDHSGKIVAVGTTVMRVLESLYYIYRYGIADAEFLQRAVVDDLEELSDYRQADVSGSFYWVSKDMAYRQEGNLLNPASGNSAFGNLSSVNSANWRYFTKEQRGEWLQVLVELAESGGGKLSGRTQIFIVLGFKFSVCDGIITNFHQPKSTLLMLVGAMVGEQWKEIYSTALQENYRFLSFGDGSLLWRR
jgi:S-adenosylmethionine:tRNA ribosyltransferase-isomerase